MQQGTADVTQEDINEGQTGDLGRADKCPVALALGRALGRPVTCGQTVAYTTDDPDNLLAITLDETATAFIVHADDIMPSTEGLEPFSFTYEIQD